MSEPIMEYKTKTPKQVPCICSHCGEVKSGLSGYLYRESGREPVCFECFKDLLRIGVPAVAKTSENPEIFPVLIPHAAQTLQVNP